MILPEHEAKGLLERAGVDLVPAKVAGSVEDAKAEAQAWGYPVVLKLSSALHSHKTEVGGVILNIRESGELESGFERLDRLRRELADPSAAIIVEPMAPTGAELFIGIQNHPAFGLVMSLGLGGVLLELVRDVTFRLLPASRADFREMLSELKTWPKLRDGFRNLPPVNPEPLLTLMERTAAFAAARPDLLEMDINPVMAYSDRAVVVDARIQLNAEGEK